MSVTEVAPASFAPVELPLLTLQLLTQLQYDRDTVKAYYDSCKRELNLHQQKSVKDIERWQQTVEELQSEINILRTRANSAVESKNELELQLEAIKSQLKTAQERLTELETLTEQKDAMLDKQNEQISEKISEIWSGIQPVVQSSEASKAILLQTKENLTAILRGVDIERLLVLVEDFVEVVHNNSNLFETKNATKQRVQELLDRVKSLEDDVENRSRLVNSFQKYLKNLTLIQDGLLKEHSKITTVVKDHKFEIIRIDARLSNMFQNFSSSYQKYKEELLQEKLKKLLDGKYKEDRILEAGKSGKTEDISLLLHFGVDTEARDTSGKTALHLAAENNHLKACQVLLDGGARIEAVATAFEGNTPLYIAAWKGHLDVVRLFVERGAKLSSKNRNGATPLKVARVWNHHNVAKYLEEKGATL